MKPETEETNLEYFRYGQGFTEDNVTFRYNRDPVIYFLAHGLVTEALEKGFNLINKSDKQPIEKNDEMKEVMSKKNNDIIQTAAFERLHGDALATLFSNSKSDKKDIRLYPADQSQYEHGYDRKGKYEHAVLTRKIHTMTVTNKDAETISTSTDDIDLNTYHTPEDSYHLITRESRIVGEGKSYIEPIFDDSIGYYVTMDNQTYFVIRVGGGTVVAYIPESDLEDPTKKQLILDDLRKLNSKGSITIMGISDDPDRPLPKLELLTGEQIDFLALIEGYHQRISLYSKVPSSRLTGLTQGELAAGEINQATYFDVLEEIQDTYTPFIKWVVSKINEIGEYNWFTDIADVDIEFETRAALTDIEKADLLSKNIDNFIKLLDKADKAGMKLEDIQTMTGLEYKIDETLITKHEEMANALVKSTEEGEETDDTDETDEDENTEE